MAQGETIKSTAMATEKAPKTPTKRGTGVGSTSDIDTIVPLLFAANPGITPNYSKMSAMDEHGRTASALEHKFRKWRHLGREILNAHPEEAGTDKAVGEPAKTKNPRSAAPKKGVSGKQANAAVAAAANDDDDENSDDAVNGKKAVKMEDEHSDDGGSNKTSPKKRGAAGKNGNESPTKKTKRRQNGKAAATKKASAAKKTPRSSQPPVAEEEINGDADGIAVKEEDDYPSANEGETNKVEMSFQQV